MLPLCFHPTEVVLVDDSTDFLFTLNMNLDTRSSNYRIFSNPQEALDYLNCNRKPNPFTNRLITNRDEDKWDHRCIDVALPRLRDETGRPDRHNEISVLVVDQIMPGLSGLELCEQITDPYFQKILLTGFADDDIAIQAFNDGIIQGYVQKQDKNMLNKLSKAISVAQERYFLNLSRVGREAIRSVNSVDHAFLDPQYESVVRNLVASHSLIEGYLCDPMGSFLFLNENGKKKILVVNNDAQLDLWLAEGQHNQVCPKILKNLEARTHVMAYLPHEDQLQPAYTEWSKYCQLAQRLESSKSVFYYTFCDLI